MFQIMLSMSVAYNGIAIEYNISLQICQACKSYCRSIKELKIDRQTLW